MRMPDRPSASDGAPPRRGWLLWWLVCSLAVTLCAFVVGSLVRSPWEAASANSERASTTTLEVEWREFPVDRPQAVGTLEVGAIVDAPSGHGDSVAVVTAAPVEVGQVVPAGARVAEVSGRPALVLELPFRLYRDLVPGDSGADVAALQQSLTGLGLYSGGADGQFGPRTSAAVRDLYRHAGADPPGAADDLVLAAQDARNALEAAVAAERRARQIRDEVVREAGTSGATSEAEADLSAAAALVASARQEAADTAAAADTPLPAAEIVRIPTGTATVVHAAAPDTLVDTTSPAVRLRAGAPSAVLRVGVEHDDAFPVGTSVEVQAADDPGASMLATVVARGEFTSDQDDDRVPGFDVTLAFPADAPVTIDSGAAVVAVPDGAPEIESGLAVPIVAVRSEGDGSFVLLVEPRPADPDVPETRAVPVVVSRTADGFALLELPEDGALEVGDHVLLGRAP